MPIIAITTNNSTSVNALLERLVNAMDFLPEKEVMLEDLTWQRTLRRTFG
jgi:hypothetical protein